MKASAKASVKTFAEENLLQFESFGSFQEIFHGSFHEGLGVRVRVRVRVRFRESFREKLPWKQIFFRESFGESNLLPRKLPCNVP